MATSNATASIRHILVPTDLSGGEEGAIRCAGNLARALQARVTLLHVLEPVPAFSEFAAALGDLQERRREWAEHGLEANARLLDGVCAAGGAVSHGRAFEQIVAYAVENGVDLIVLGRTRDPGLLHQLLGSTAERVVRHAPCAVLVLSAERGTETGPVCLGTDLSPVSLLAAPWAEEFARLLGKSLLLVNVQPPLALPGTPVYERHSVEIDRLRREAASALQECGEQSLDGEVHPDCVVLEGTPCQELCQEAKRCDAALLVLATRGATNWPAALIGSTAERVVRHAGVPVLVVPAA